MARSEWLGKTPREARIQDVKTFLNSRLVELRGKNEEKSNNLLSMNLQTSKLSAALDGIQNEIKSLSEGVGAT